MALDAIARLPEELLDWFGVMTHLHPGGNSECSGQQTPSDISMVLPALGVSAGVITPHTGNPSKPYLLDPFGVEFAVLKHLADEVGAVRKQTSVDLRFGLECNTVPTDYGFQLDTSEEMVEALGSTYTIGSLHGDAAAYKNPGQLMAAIQMLCESPVVDSLGHITRYVSDVKVDWYEVAQMAASTNTLIELNLNLWFKEHGQNNVKPSDHPNAVFHRKFLEAVGLSEANCVIGIDAHNLGMFPLAKAEQGWETTIGRCLAFVDALEDGGITPSRVISSNFTCWEGYFDSQKADRKSPIL